MAQRRKALPQLPAKLDPQTRQYLSSLQEMIETGEGTRGDPLDTKLTFRDLIKSGIARLKGQIGPGGVTGDQLEPGGVPDLSTPPAPQGAEFVAVFDAVTALWDDPYAAYSNHAHTEIWRADGVNADFSSASLIGVSEGSMYSDYTVEGGSDYTYWIRFASTADVRGPWHKPGGTSIQALVSVERMLEELSGQIDESILANSFKDRLDGFQESISEQGDLYTLTLNNNGHVSGFGTYNDGKTSDFAVIADRFWIAPPNSTGKVKPFMISGGNVYIDSAFIRDASIQEGKLGPISFGKIKDNYGRPVTTLSGKLKAQNIDVDSLQVTNANISGDLWSTNYSPGNAGWKIWRNGNAEFNAAEFRGKINFADLEVQGRPASEVATLSDGLSSNSSSSQYSIGGAAAYISGTTPTANVMVSCFVTASISMTAIMRARTWATESASGTTDAHLSVSGTIIIQAKTDVSSWMNIGITTIEKAIVMDAYGASYNPLHYPSGGPGSVSRSIPISCSGAGSLLLGSGGGSVRVRVLASVEKWEDGSVSSFSATIGGGSLSGNAVFHRF